MSLTTTTTDDKTKRLYDALLYHNSIARQWLQSISAARHAITVEDIPGAAEIIAEMPRKVFNTLWRAPKYGAMWETSDRTFMSENEEFKEILHTIKVDTGWFENPENDL